MDNLFNYPTKTHKLELSYNASNPKTYLEYRSELVDIDEISNCVIVQNGPEYEYKYHTIIPICSVVRGFQYIEKLDAEQIGYNNITLVDEKHFVKMWNLFI